MISLDNAKRLKELLPPHNYKEGDWGWWSGDDEELGPKLVNREPTHAHSVRVLEDCSTWLPTLSQLLEEVEKQGWAWELCNIKVYSEDSGYEVSLFEKAGKKFIPHEERCQFVLDADTPEDAVALALISILETDGKRHLSEIKCDKGDHYC